MSIGPMVKRWSESISISTPNTTIANEYNQYSYTNSTITGRLIETEEEVIVDSGEKIIAKAKIFTQSSNLQLDTKVGDYKIFSKKVCKDKNNVVQFYKYFLK